MTQTTAMGQAGPDYDNLSFHHGEHELYPADREYHTIFAHHPEYGNVGHLTYRVMEHPSWTGFESPTVHVTMMGVDPEHQRRGVASQLMNHLENHVHPDTLIDHGNRKPEGEEWSKSHYKNPKGGQEDWFTHEYAGGKSQYTKNGRPWNIETKKPYRMPKRSSVYTVRLEHGTRQEPGIHPHIKHPTNVSHVQIHVDAFDEHGNQRPWTEMDNEAKNTAVHMTTAPGDMVTKADIIRMEAARSSDFDPPKIGMYGDDQTIHWHDSSTHPDNPEYWHPRDWSGATRKVLHPDHELHTTQEGWIPFDEDDTDPDSNPMHYLHHPEDYSKRSDQDIPQVARVNGKDWIGHGHHRLMADRRLQRPTTVLYKDLDAERQRKTAHTAAEDGDSLDEFGYHGPPIAGQHHKIARFTPHLRVFAPTCGMDHRLWDANGKLKPEVRSYILKSITQMWGAKYKEWSKWARVYFAGSEASEWTSETLEGNNDFDVLVGVDYDKFLKSNPAYGHSTTQEITDQMNEGFKAFNGPVMLTIDGVQYGPFDRTTYVNKDSYDIRDIKPYAAYDVGADKWIEKPPHLPHWGLDKLPDPTKKVLQAADTLARRTLKLPEPERTQQGAALFDAWHSDRSRAFGPNGEGWWDIANLREKWLDQGGLWAQLVDCKHKFDEGLGAAKDWSNTPKTAAGFKTFDQLAPHERAAAETYHEQMKEDGIAAPDETPHAYHYELRQEPRDQFIKRYMDADDEFKEAYGPDQFQEHHEETLKSHPIPHHPRENRWPLIVNDDNPNYVDDGYHRMHSYMRDGATHIPTMRMHYRGAKTAIQQPDPNGPLRHEPGKTFYRLHGPERRFSPNDASSKPFAFSEEGTRARGYSSFDNPHDLHRYMRGMDWMDHRGDADDNFERAKIVQFRGHQNGWGYDDEKLAIPDNRKDRQEFSIPHFLHRLKQTPHPDVERHWHRDSEGNKGWFKGSGGPEPGGFRACDGTGCHHGWEEGEDDEDHVWDSGLPMHRIPDEHNELALQYKRKRKQHTAATIPETLDEIGKQEHPNVDHYQSGGRGHLPGDESRSVVGFLPVHMVRQMREHDGNWNGEESRNSVNWVRKDIREGKGITNPLTIHYDHKNGWGYLGEGNHRLRAAREEGLKTVPVRVVRDSGSGIQKRREEGIGHSMHAHTGIDKDAWGDDYVPSDMHPYHFLGWRPKVGSAEKLFEDEPNFYRMWNKPPTGKKTGALHPYTQQDWFHGGDLDHGRTLYDKVNRSGTGHLHVGTQKAALDRIDPDTWDARGEFSTHIPHARLYRMRLSPGARICPKIHEDNDDAGSLDFKGHDDYDVHAYRNAHEGEKGGISLVGKPHVFRVEEELGRHPKWGDERVRNEWTQEHTAAWHDSGDLPEGRKPRPKAVRRAGFAGFVAGSDWVKEFRNKNVHPNEMPDHIDDHLGHFARDHGMSMNNWKKNGKLGVVDLSRGVFATQTHVSQFHMDRFRKKPDDDAWALHKENPGGSIDADKDTKDYSDAPMFVTHQGRLHLIDGHHRVAANLQEGHKQAFGWHYNLDAKPVVNVNGNDCPTCARHASESAVERRTASRAHSLWGKGLDALFRPDEDGPPLTAPVPFPQSPTSKNRGRYDHKRVARSITHPHEFPVQDVDPRELHATQPAVTRSGVKDYMEGKPGSDNRLGNDIPRVYHRTEDDHKFLLSGHHRATAALLRGEPLRAIIVQGGFGPDRTK